MKLNVFCDKLEDLKCDALVIFNEKGKVAVRGQVAEINQMLGSKLSEIFESHEFVGRQDQFHYFYTFEKIPNIPRIALTGFDLQDEDTLNVIRSAAAGAVKSMRDVGMKKVAILVPAIAKWQLSDVARAVVEGILLGLYRFEKYQEKKSKKSLSEVILVGEAKDRRTLEKAILLGEMEASGVLLARDVGNEPSNVLTPKNFAGIAKKMMQKVKVGVNVLEESDLKKEGLGLLYGVGKASANPPQLALLKYHAGNKYPTVGLVGKGITFDSGGVDLKVGSAAGPMFFDMKRDMGGAAAVLGLMYIIGQLKPKINVIGALPLAENMLSGDAYKPGDILVSYSGKSVEIFQTDAEGRLAMADAMSYIQENNKIDYIIDIATLTGSQVRMCGPRMMGLFANDNRLAERIKKAGLAAGEETMEFPLVPAYRTRIKSHFADIKNFSFKDPFMISSALFLQEFVKENVKWAHLDIASMVSSSGEGTYLTRGATGVGVRLLAHLILGMGK